MNWKSANLKLTIITCTISVNIGKKCTENGEKIAMVLEANYDDKK